MQPWESNPNFNKIQTSLKYLFKAIRFLKEKIKVTKNNFLKSLICHYVDLRIKSKLQENPNILTILLSDITYHCKES